MDWESKIQECIDLTGKSEQQISEDLVQWGADVSQSTIHRIRTGAIAEPKYHIGNAIIQLHSRILRNHKRSRKNVQN